MTTKNIFDQVQLAEASYANLAGVETQGDLETALKIGDKAPFEPSQAAEFIKHWKGINKGQTTVS
jgi:hypothetical protein